MAYNPGKKSYTTPLYVGEKTSITRGLEEQKSHPNQIAHITHQKWNGRPLKVLSLVLIYGALPEFICHDCLSNPGPIKV